MTWVSVPPSLSLPPALRMLGPGYLYPGGRAALLGPSELPAHPGHGARAELELPRPPGHAREAEGQTSILGTLHPLLPPARPGVSGHFINSSP